MRLSTTIKFLPGHAGIDIDLVLEAERLGFDARPQIPDRVHERGRRQARQKHSGQQRVVLGERLGDSTGERDHDRRMAHAQVARHPIELVPRYLGPRNVEEGGDRLLG